MRNHVDKPRDIARSVLASTAGNMARTTRAQIHQRERSRVRNQLRQLAPGGYDDFDGDLDFGGRRHIGEMVNDRRAADKVGPLLRWATRRLERQPRLADAKVAAVEGYFRGILPAGLVGDHALSHLGAIFGPRHPAGARRGLGAEPDWLDQRVQLVNRLVAEGLHGELNRRLRAASLVPIRVRVPAPPTAARSTGSPPRRRPQVITVHQHRPVRFLGGAHDVAAFACDADEQVFAVARALHHELVRPQPTG